MANIYAVGAGMVGRAMALDLANDHKVFLADLDLEALHEIQSKNPAIQIHQLDVTDKNTLSQWVEPADIVLLAVPGFLGFETLKTIISCGKNVVDISFSPENILTLSPLAKENNATIIVDAGVAPGLPNYLLGYYDTKMDIRSFEYYVGGLPKHPVPPFNYKAPFSPIDVIEEYTRPARMMVDGNLVTRPALSEIETFHYEGVGQLEAFNTDGLRSILRTMGHIPSMKEKTLRYPGHGDLMKNYRDRGLFDEENLEKTSKKLLKAWALEKNESEFTLLHTIIKGVDETISYFLYDEFDPDSGLSSMSRTTGYTATGTVNLLLDGLWTDHGVFPPEIVGQKGGCLHYILNYLKERNIKITKQ